MVNYRLYISDKNEGETEGPYFMKEEVLPKIGEEIILTAAVQGEKPSKNSLVTKVIHRHKLNTSNIKIPEFDNYIVWAKKII